jgi:hypothetical protein
MDDKLLILRAFSTLNQVRDAKVPELSLLPSFHELVEDLRARLSAPEPEPVAWVYDKFNWESWGDGSWQITVTQNKEQDDQQPLYTAPLQREWQGLTDEEISELIRNTHNTGSFVRAIEAKLKEKNT